MKEQDILEKAANIGYLSIGCNLGNKLQNINKTIFLLKLTNIKIIISSGIYQTHSWPNPKFPDFYNLIIKIRTFYNLKELFKIVKNIEKKIGTRNRKKNYPRKCDIDIIDFNNKILFTKENDQIINVPHVRMHLRNFVLFPLFEINKSWTHPKYKKNIVKLLTELPISDISTIKKI